MANYRTMKNRLRLFTMGGLGEILQDGDVYGELVNRAYDDIWSDYPWSYKRTNQIVNTVPPKSNGRITVATGSPAVIGTGTGFTVADKGSFLWVGGVGTTPLPIINVAGNQIVTLSAPFAGPTLTQTSYICAPLYYLVEGSDEIISIVSNDVQLQKRLREEINVIDPTRTDQGGAPSCWWCEAPPSMDGSLMVELWPTPQDARAYLVEYFRKTPLLENDIDIPLIPSQLVEEKAMITACEMMYASTGQQTWLQLRQSHQMNLDGGLTPPAGKLGEALDRDATRQQYIGREQQPTGWLGEYDSSFTPLHIVFGS